MRFKVVNVSRGDIRLTNDGKEVRVLGEALIASAPTDPSFVVYLNSVDHWEGTPLVALTEAEKQEIMRVIRRHFQDRGSLVEFE